MDIHNLIPFTTIENQEFEHVTLVIRKEDFENIELLNDRMTFTFDKCKFKSITLENIDIIDFVRISLEFVDCYIEKIDANKINSKYISIIFSSSILSGTIQNSNISQVYFNNCIIIGKIYLIGLKRISISLSEDDISPRRWINFMSKINKSFLDLIRTTQSYNIISSENITFITSEIEAKKRGVYKKRTRIGYYFTKEQKNELNINLSIQYSQKAIDIDTIILNSNLNSLTISGYSAGKISVDNNKISNLMIDNFSTQNEANFYNISPLKKTNTESKIEIHKSNLDNNWFDNIDFSEYNIVSFYRTKFGKAIFTACNFPNDYTSFDKFKTLENANYPDRKSDNYYKDQYEIFLQLKIILESTGNFYESQKLQAISNDALKKINQISKWDKAILWINSKSNNHGLSIGRPLGYFFIFSISFYILYLYSLDRIFNENSIDFSLIGYYFSFLDLTHRTDFLVDKSEFNAFSLFIDFVSKLISGFFIYQFVSAFRKYGKK